MSICPGYRWIVIRFVHIPLKVMFIMISIISTADAIVPVVELFEWCRGVIVLHSKAGGSAISFIGVVASFVITFTSLSTLCHSKTVASLCGVAP